MVTRIGGLASGMDIDELVENLMKAERAPLDKLEQQKQIYEWTRDAYRSVNTKLQTFDTYIADNFVLKSLNTKTATSSNSSLVDAIATSSAAGTLTIEGVSQLASAARAIGGQVNAIGTTTLADLFENSGVTIDPNKRYIEIRAIQKDGTLATKATRIDFTENMTVNEFISKINSSNAGVSAVFENGRLSITAKNTGDVKGGAEIVVDTGKGVFEAFGLTITNGNEIASNGKNAIFQVNGIATERSSNSFTISGYTVTLKDTFNSKQTIAEKYTAALLEKKLADENYDAKLLKRDTAKENYYGLNPSSTPSYTDTHNALYLAAFGNTLSLSDQEVFNKLGSAFWRKLTSEELALINDPSNANVNDLKAAIENSTGTNYANLKSILNDESKLQALVDLSSSKLDEFREHANYQVYGTKLKVLDADAIAAIKSFAYDSNDDLTTIRKNIDEHFTDPDLKDVKDLLKSLSKDALTELLATDSATLERYQQKAEADDLKAKYAALGDAFFTALDANDIYELTNNVDFEKPISEIPNDDLRNKLQNLLTKDGQFATLGSIVNANKLSDFVALAGQNDLRNKYIKAEKELTEADARRTTAIYTLETARADAEAAEILDGDEIDPTKVNNEPKTSAVTLTSATNVDEIVNKIKEFVKTYNGLITELNNLVKETKYRDYQPLTEAQKKDMKEKEIELWEEKAKSGLLRSDSIIMQALTNMRSLIYETNYGVSNTQYNTLYSIGLTTTKSYNDGGLIEIDETKLRKALEEEPDSVVKLFNNVSGKKDEKVVVNGVEKKVDTRGYLNKLRDVISNAKLNIEKKAGRSTMTDTQYTLGKTLKDIADRISSWKTRLETIETRYWKQFTAMEQAINKANMQASYFQQQSY